MSKTSLIITKSFKLNLQEKTNKTNEILAVETKLALALQSINTETLFYYVVALLLKTIQL